MIHNLIFSLCICPFIKNINYNPQKNNNFEIWSFLFNLEDKVTDNPSTQLLYLLKRNKNNCSSNIDHYTYYLINSSPNNIFTKKNDALIESNYNKFNISFDDLTITENSFLNYEFSSKIQLNNNNINGFCGNINIMSDMNILINSNKYIGTGFINHISSSSKLDKQIKIFKSYCHYYGWNNNYLKICNTNNNNNYGIVRYDNNIYELKENNFNTTIKRYWKSPITNIKYPIKTNIFIEYEKFIMYITSKAEWNNNEFMFLDKYSWSGQSIGIILVNNNKEAELAIGFMELLKY